MIVKLEAAPYGDGFLPIPEVVLQILGWREGDDISLDVSMTNSDTLIVHKVDHPSLTSCTCYPWDGIHANNCPKNNLKVKSEVKSDG